MLPRSLDETKGLRAARWIRESTTGQYDNYGPDSQRRQQDLFIERHGLVDTGLVWQVAQSGTTVWRSEAMAEMVESARAELRADRTRNRVTATAAKRHANPRSGAKGQRRACRRQDKTMRGVFMIVGIGSI